MHAGRSEDVQRRDFIGLVVMGMIGGVGGTSLAVAPAAGKPAPEFSLTLMDGRVVSLKDFRGKPVLVNFWASG
jgi:cytochrome oxidase Cu insertion factor (SCO1/SenC/PrrC family)